MDIEGAVMRRRILALALALAVSSGVARTASAADYHHMHLTASSAEEGAQWYIKNMACEPVPNRSGAAQCGTVLFLFYARQPTGPSDGTGANHIGFSFTDIAARIAALQSAGVKVTAPPHDVPGLFKIAFVEDPWGTRIELVEDPEYLGFHHIHLASPDTDKTLSWYQNVFGGQRTKLRGRLDAVLYGKIWLLALRSTAPVAPTEGRAIDHLGFSFPDLDAAAVTMKQKGVQFQQEPHPITSPSSAKISFVAGPDSVRIEVVEPVKH
jgi:catechol 2,3-dioxygenase-like lactoylglutathione lyase family enzyme